ncbi:MAG: hypothetical protein ABSA74_02070 [Candidatus Staskawiczbacteria bacterium]|jgi:hypothetical protein
MANKQKIIFNVPGEETAADIISDILEKNGVQNVTEDLLLSPENSKLVFLNNALKDFFDKKLSEENFLDTLQKRLQITKESAAGMLKDAKEKLFPYAEKVAIRTEHTEENIITAPIKPMANNSKIIAEGPTASVEEKPLEKRGKLPKNISKPPEITQKNAPNFSKKPDTYREPIE